MNDDFDAGALADVATGGSTSASPGEMTVSDGVADVAEGVGGGGGGDPDAGDDGYGSLLRSLLLAPERGPTQPTFTDVGVPADPALVLDGVIDWLLDVVDVDDGDVDDTLGPIGKIGIGLAGMFRSLSDDGDGDDDGEVGVDAETDGDLGAMV